MEVNIAGGDTPLFFMVKFFEGISDATELKKLRNQLMIEHHPDKGGNDELAKEINFQYEQAVLRLAIQASADFRGSSDLSLVIRGKMDGLVDQEQLITVAISTNKARLRVAYATMEMISWITRVTEEEMDDLLKRKWYDFARKGYYINQPLSELINSYHKRIYDD